MLRQLCAGAAEVSRQCNLSRNATLSLYAKHPRNYRVPGSKQVLGKFKVLFCGSDFPWAYKLTKEELKTNTDVEVCFCDQSEVADKIRSAHAIVPLMTKLDKTILEEAPQLQMIIQYGLGLEGVDSHQALSRGIHVASIPSHGTGNAMSCAEHALYLTLALLKQQNEMARSIQERKIGEPLGQMLAGKNVMIIGYGGIAQQLIPLLKPFRVRMIGLRKRDWSTGNFSQQSHEVSKMLSTKIRWAAFPQYAPRTDIIILTCTETKETFKMVNHTFLDQCRPGVKIVNVGRSGLMDYDAVLNGLNDGQIGGLAMDTQWTEPFDPHDPIAKHPKVILTPHVAGVTETSYKNIAKIIAEQVRRLVTGRSPSRDINCLRH